MSKNKCNCPKCGSEKFVTEPNQYDILIFTAKGFEIQETAQIDGCKIFCRACGAEIDEAKSIKKVVPVKKRLSPPK
ncbi:MAG: hypothetical protein RLZZ628_1514 [Bacteroidota bacterium]